MESYFPILMLLVIAVGISILLLFLQSFLGQYRPNAIKNAAFNCGNPPEKLSVPPRFNIKFYLVAMVFIVFDIETVFLFPWAVLYQKLGITGLIEMGIFMLFLLLGLVYLWRKGVLDN